MEIIDNFRIPSKTREGFNPWLENILDLIKSFAGDKKQTIRLSGDRRNNTIVYKLRNSHNKTSAEIYKRNKMYYLNLHKRDLPDMEKSIRPDNIILSSHVFKKGDIDELAKIAELVCELVTSETPYSLGEIAKMEVSPIQLLDRKTLIGGQITGISYKDCDVAEVVIENGRAKFQLKIEKIEKSRIKLLKCIIFNDRGEMAVVSSQEFDFYYQMV